jgi:hypothetical protein
MGVHINNSKTPNATWKTSFLPCWKGLGDLDSFDEDWIAITMWSTSQKQGLATRVCVSRTIGGLLDEGIDMENLLVDGFLRWTHLHPLHKLETKPNTPCLGPPPTHSWGGTMCL